MIALDTETTGVDMYHGAMPFFVTVCEAGSDEPLFWEWDVDPLTRQPLVPREDLDEIWETVNSHDAVVMQNGKFDVAALKTLDRRFEDWPWGKTEDTLIAGHLLASNLPHDLTSMTYHYLGKSISRFEEELNEEVAKARRWCRSKYKDWGIAKEGRPDMPSAKEKTWKFDTWLPRAVATAEGRPEDDPWWTVLSKYAQADSAATVHLWMEMDREIHRRGLAAIYKTSLQRVRLAHGMETRGVTISRPRLECLQAQYREESDKAGQTCVAIAENYDPDDPIELSLPKSGNNKALESFASRLLSDYHVKSDPGQASMDYGSGSSRGVLVHRTDTGRLAINKAAIESYLAELDPDSEAARFFTALRGKRKLDTAFIYLEGYKRFWLPWEGVLRTDRGRVVHLVNPDWFVLHPSLNPTGTDTLRWSSSNPNSQNISKQDTVNLRYCFGPAPGREWWSLDAKNIELRIPAYESGEVDLIKLFERPDDPPYYGSTHLLNFSAVYPEIWGRELEEVGVEKVGPHCKKKYASTWYQWCKNGGFAVQYGAVDREDGEGTADRAFHRRGAHALLKTRFSKLEALNQKWIRFAEEHGYVETTPDRSVDPKRGYPILCSRTNYGRIKPTVPLNYHVQGTAMWWTMVAMIRCQEYLDELNAPIAPRLRPWLGYHMTIQCHDELVFDFPAGRGPEPWRTNLPKIRRVQKIMEGCGAGIGVPTPVGVEYHRESWAEGKTV